MKKKMVFVSGDKGGVGKSFFSRILADFYREKSIEFRAYDTDSTNSTLFRFYENDTYQINIENQTELDSLLGSIPETNGNIILDCGATVLDRLSSWMNDVSFLDLQEELEFDVTLAFVMGPEKDCVQILRDVVDRFEGRVRYVIVKNLAKGRSFEIYNSSNTRKRLLEEFSAIELELPALFEGTTHFLDKFNLAFTNALTFESTQIADRQRIKKFRNDVFKTLDVQVNSPWIS